MTEITGEKNFLERGGDDGVANLVRFDQQNSTDPGGRVDPPPQWVSDAGDIGYRLSILRETEVTLSAFAFERTRLILNFACPCQAIDGSWVAACPGWV